MSTTILLTTVFISTIFVSFLIALLFFIIKKNFSNRSNTVLINYMKLGKYKEAIKVAKDILAKDPDNFEAHYFLGNCYDKEGKYELALIEYRAADKLGIFTPNINEYDLRERLAELYKKFNKIDEALKEYALLYNKNPNDPFVNQKMAELFDLKGDKKLAYNYYMKSYEIKKNNPAVALNLGVILYEFKKFSESEKFLLESIKNNEENFKGYYYLGLVYKNLNDNKKALEFLDKATRSKEYKVKALTEKGLILATTGKYEEATIELERALKNTTEADSLNMILNIRYILASCYEANRNITEAIKNWEYIYSKKPDFKNVNEKLNMYQDLRMDDAMKDFITATSQDFQKICKCIAENMKFNIEDLKMSPQADSVEMIVSDITTGAWRNEKKKLKILKIYRMSDPVDEKPLREIVERMKQKDLFKAIIISSSSFTNQAILFCQERPIQLIDKNELQNILKNIKF